MKLNFLALMSAIMMAVIMPTPTQAQELDIEWGTEFASNTEVQKILGFIDSKMVVYSKKGKKRFIETYKKDGYGQISSKEFQLPKINSKNSGMLNLSVTGKVVSAILYIYDKRSKSFSLHRQKITLNGTMQGGAELVYKSAGGEKIKNRKVDMIFSPGNSKAMVYFSRTDKERLNYMSDVVILDLENNMELVSKTEHSFKMKSSKSQKVKYKLYHELEDDGGYGIIQEKVIFSGTKISSFALDVSVYKKSGDLKGTVKLNEPGKVLLSPTMIVRDDKVVVVGYYMNNPKNRSTIKGYTGLFYAELNAALDNATLKTNKFSDDFLSNLYSAKKIARSNNKDKELLVPAPYTMNEIFVHGDGSLTVLSEFFQVVTTTNDRGQTTTTTTYGPILYMKLNKDGDFIKADAIKKKQVSRTSSIGGGVGAGLAGGLTASFFVSVELPDKKLKYWSFASSTKDGNVYLVFNDHFKNAQDSEDDLSKPMMNPKKSIPYMVTIHPDGTFKKKAMVTSGDLETYTVPKITYHLDAGEFIIWGIWRKTNKFGHARIK